METLKYPCNVCTLGVCVGADCPAANGDEQEFHERLRIRLEQEFPEELEEEGDVSLS